MALVSKIRSTLQERVQAAAEQRLRQRLGPRLEPLLRRAESVVGAPALKEARRWVDLPALNKKLLREEHRDRVVHVRSFPEELTLATTVRCNKKPPCTICERNLRTTDLEWDCPDIVLDRLRPVLPHLDILYLHCSGEPLFYHRFSELLSWVRPPTKVRFNSNAVLLTDERIRAIMDAEVVDVLNFSLDAATEATYEKIRGPGFKKVVQNIKNLSAEKERRGSSIPFIVVNMCITRANHRELPALADLAHELGAGCIDLFHLNHGPQWRLERPGGFVWDYREQEEMDPEEHDALILEAHARARELGVDMNFVGSVFMTQKNNEEKQEVGEKIRELNRWEHGCLAPWSRAVVGVDGNVRICYFHKEWEESIGNLIFNDFEEIWNGERARTVRQEFVDRGHSVYCQKENYCMFLGRV